MSMQYYLRRQGVSNIGLNSIQIKGILGLLNQAARGERNGGNGFCTASG